LTLHTLPCGLWVEEMGTADAARLKVRLTLPCGLWVEEMGTADAARLKAA